MADEEKTLDVGSASASAESSSISAPPAPQPPPIIDPIPDGGVRAWLQVLGSFFLFLNSWGIVNTFGVYQTYYATALPESPSDISWIGSIQAYLLLLVGVATGPLFDAGYFRHLLFAGSFLVVFGMMMTSICTRYWEVMLAQAVCVGVGCGCLFVPSVAIIATYFSRKKAFATGLAASGSSLGGVIYPIVFHRLQPTIGFGWATRILGFIMLATLSISLLGMRTRLPPGPARKLLDIGALHEPPFVLFTSGMFFGFMGLYIPFFYVQSFAIETNVMRPDLAFYMLAVMNGASVFGRIIPNFVADRVGPLNILLPGTLAACVLAFGWLGIESSAGLIVFCVLYGFFSGCFVSIPPTVVVTLSPNPSVIGTRIGMCFAICGLGILIGTPVAGTLVRKYGFDAAIGFTGAAVAIGTLILFAARTSKVGFRVKVIT